MNTDLTFQDTYSQIVRLREENVRLEAENSRLRYQLLSLGFTPEEENKTQYIPPGTSWPV